MNGQLTARLARDLDGSFEGLVLAHQDRLYTIAVRFLGDPGDAEEATQDAFVRAYRALATYEPARIRELQLKPWLATIVVNVCRNRVRRRQPTVVRLDHPSTGDEGDVDAAGAVTTSDERTIPHDWSLRREAAERWAGLVLGLPERYRLPVLLRHVDGLSYDEMSEILGRPEGTLKAQVHRGVALLRGAAQRAHVLDREEMTA